MNNEYWEKYPVHSIIYSIVSREKTISLENLVNKVKEENPEVDIGKIRMALVKLEIWNKIDVVSSGKEIKILFKGE